MKLSFFLASLSTSMVASRMLVAIDQQPPVQMATTGRHSHAHRGGTVSGEVYHLTKDIGETNGSAVSRMERTLHAHGNGSKGHKLHAHNGRVGKMRGKRQLHAHNGSGKMGMSGRQLHAYEGGKGDERYLLELELAMFSDHYFSQRELSTTADMLSMPGVGNTNGDPRGQYKGLGMKRQVNVHRGKTTMATARPMRNNENDGKGSFTGTKRSKVGSSFMTMGRRMSVRGHGSKAKGPSMKMERHLQAHGKSATEGKASKTRRLPKTEHPSNRRNLAT